MKYYSVIRQTIASCWSSSARSFPFSDPTALKLTPHIFMGYLAATDGFICFDPFGGRMVITRDVTFFESDFT